MDIEGVRFLNACESAGISILHCSALHQGMDAARSRKSRSDPDGAVGTDDVELKLIIQIELKEEEHITVTSRTWFWCMVHSPTAPVGKLSSTSSRMTGTRCRWCSTPRPRTPKTKSTRRPRSTPVRAGGSGGPQLRRGRHHRSRQSSKGCGACLYCRIRAGHWGKLCHDRASLTASHHGDQADRNGYL